MPDIKVLFVEESAQQRNEHLSVETKQFGFSICTNISVEAEKKQQQQQKLQQPQ